jgi:hypothetical protein
MTAVLLEQVAGPGVASSSGGFCDGARAAMMQLSGCGAQC